ncbi:MAG: DUF5060 domain-containing protein [Phycisphaeraceae bacterium]
MTIRWNLSVLVLACLLSSVAAARDMGTTSTTLYGKHLEWRLKNPSYDGNPFDLDARVIFTHKDTKQKLTTGMFYDDHHSWRWRFTGTQPGRWTFRTVSADPQLHGRTGTVNVVDDPTAHGFIVGRGTRWARQVGTSDYKAILPNHVMYHSHPDVYHNKPWVLSSDLKTFVDDHGFTGLHVPDVAGHWFDLDSDGTVTSDMVNPDPRTFQALEQLITAANGYGASVHFWTWGDSSRGTTSNQLQGGQNGAVDQRLQRYIAARLGPLQGWTMGYGFDLDEWTTNDQMQEWRDRINGHSGWDHLLSGRSLGPNSGTDHSSDVGWHVGLDYAGYEHHRPTYAVYLAALRARIDGEPVGKPVMSEDRFRVRNRAKDYTPEETRRGLWQATMAGGVANIWGNLRREDGTIIDHDVKSLTYPNREQIKTWSTFFVENDRFTLDMEVDNRITGGMEKMQVALHGDESGMTVVYAEDTDTIELNLAHLRDTHQWFGTVGLTLVDTTEAYREIDLGESELIDMELDLTPHGGVSDWAVLITGQAAPEPASAVLLLLGGSALALRRSRARRGAA